MKHLRETFTDQEFEALNRVKVASKKNWHDFLLTASKTYEDWLEDMKIITGGLNVREAKEK